MYQDNNLYNKMADQHERSALDYLIVWRLSIEDKDDLLQIIIEKIVEIWKKYNPNRLCEQLVHDQIERELPKIVEEAVIKFKDFKFYQKHLDISDKKESLIDRYCRLLSKSEEILKNSLDTQNKKLLKFLYLEFLVIRYWEEDRIKGIGEKSELKKNIKYRRKLFFFLTYYIQSFRNFILDLIDNSKNEKSDNSQKEKKNLDISGNNKLEMNYCNVFETLRNTLDNDRKEIKKNIMKNIQSFLEKNNSSIEIDINLIKDFMKIRFDWEEQIDG